MNLGAATHFAQGWNLGLLNSAAGLGIGAIRDGISWATIEKSRGNYDFSGKALSYLDATAKANVDVNVVFNWGNKLYDGGFTPYTAEGRLAFAKFIDATLDRYDNIASIEIGNEFNGNQFVSGPVKDAAYSERDNYYHELVKVVYETIRAEHPDVQILGGSTHSVPVGYIKSLVDLGTLNYLDGITIHPYTTDPDQLSDQLALLRQAMGANQKAIHVTEFGSNFEKLEDASAYLLKMTSVMGANDIDSAYWYALAEQKIFPNMQLVSQQGVATASGTTFEFIQNRLMPLGDVKDISPDGATYAYAFGNRGLILWGEGGKVSFTGPVTVFDSLGKIIPNFDGTLDPKKPIIVLSDSDLTPGQTVQFTPSKLVADSFHHFDVSNSADGSATFEGPWSYWALTGTGKLSALTTMLGGERADELWTPYLGDAYMRPLRVTAEAVNPVDFGKTAGTNNQKSIVERFTADKDMTVNVKGSWDVVDTSKDGVILKVMHNGKLVIEKAITDKATGYKYDLKLDKIDLHTGDTLDFVLGTNQTSQGSDLTARRIQIFETEKEAAPAQPLSKVVVDAPARVFSETLVGGQGNDKLVVKLTAGDSAIYGHAGNDILTGRNGNDRLDGGAGNDTLKGFNGDDIIIGGDGNDILYGGAGRDTFRFDNADGYDIVRDYQLDVDAPIELTSGGQYWLAHQGKNTLLSYGETTVLFRDVHLDNSDFTVFVG